MPRSCLGDVSVMSRSCLRRVSVLSLSFLVMSRCCFGAENRLGDFASGATSGGSRGGGHTVVPRIGLVTSKGERAHGWG